MQIIRRVPDKVTREINKEIREERRSEEVNEKLQRRDDEVYREKAKRSPIKN